MTIDILSIQGLYHTYPNGVQALENISLEIPGGMFGLLGPNGAGKSSLMRTIATLQQPTQGQIKFGDIDVLKSPDRLRRVLGYLPQDFGVYPRGSAYELLDQLAVLKGLTRSKQRRQAVEQRLMQTNLFEVRHQRLAGFSGGMRQRFGVAQALLGNPRLIIVDEPTAGLDPEERNRFHNLLSEISEEIVVILSTHIVEDVAELCPRMGVLVAGRLVLEGSPEALRQALAGQIWSRPIDKQEQLKLPEHCLQLSSQLFNGRRRVRVKAENSPGAGFEPTLPTLEDVYFTAVRSTASTAAPPES